MFAANLMLLSVRNVSIAHCCRELLINRQQYNKYLSGAVFPNERTMDHICGYFGYDPIRMITSLIDEVVIEKSNDSKWRSFVENIAGNISLSNPGTDISAGTYSYYFPSSEEKESCIRGLIVIQQQADFSYFTRITRAKTGSLLQASPVMLVTDGIIAKENNNLMFLGQTRHARNSFTLMNLRVNNGVRQNYYTGLFLTYAPGGRPTALRYILKRVGEIGSWRHHYRKMGIKLYNDPSISEDVRKALHTDFSGDKSSIESADTFAHWIKTKLVH